MAKRKPTPKQGNPAPAHGKSDEDQAVSLARTALRPTVQAAFTLQEYDKGLGNLDLLGLVTALSDQTKAANDGNLNRADDMLMVQAHTLDAIFNNLARRAINAEYLDHLDRYLKLALRAQSQCRATWETLAMIKNPPPVAFVRQANIAHGPQQVNNNSPAAANPPSRARENSSLQNELLEEQHGERLDTRAAGTAGGADPAMAAVGAVDRTSDEAG